MREFGESLFIWFFVSSALVSAVLYPLALIIVFALLIPFFAYEAKNIQQRKYYASRVNAGPVEYNSCITELAAETCFTV